MARQWESSLQMQVAEYLCRQYPDVMFHSDFGSGVKLSKIQAVVQLRQNGYRRGWPDLFIAEPVWMRMKGDPEHGFEIVERRLASAFSKTVDMRGYSLATYNGLFIELKKEGTRLKKKNGEWASEHIAEQAEILRKLADRGYEAQFAVGFDEAIELIDKYLGGK